MPLIDMQNLIHFIHVGWNPSSSNDFRMKSHSSMSYAFSISSFNANHPLWFFNLWKEFRISFIINILYIMDFSSPRECTLQRINNRLENWCSVLTIIFEMILYIVVQRLIGRKWVDLSGLKFFGISVIRVWFRLLNKWPCLKKVLIASQRFWPIMGQKVWKNETPKSSDPCDLSGFMSNKASLIRHLE